MPAESRTGTCDDGLAAFMSVRARLFGIAYRMLRSAAEAEDVVQDAWVRWQTVDRSVVRDAAAYLVATATRLALNVIQSARSRRETYVDRWLPEPVDDCADARSEVEGRQALASGVQLLLETLTPMERAAYVLREAFDYSYSEIAKALRLEEANARQVVTRARQRAADGRRITASSTARRRLLAAFVAAAQNGDVTGLESLLASDARLERGRRRFGAVGRAPVAGRRGVRARSVVALPSGTPSRRRRLFPADPLRALNRHNGSPHPVNGS